MKNHASAVRDGNGRADLRETLFPCRITRPCEVFVRMIEADGNRSVVSDSGRRPGSVATSRFEVLEYFDRIKLSQR